MNAGKNSIVLGKTFGKSACNNVVKSVNRSVPIVGLALKSVFRKFIVCGFLLFFAIAIEVAIATI